MTRIRTRILCDRCGEDGPHHGRGLCNACWKTVKATGTLENWPLRSLNGVAQARAENYQWLREEGLTRQESAWRLGVSIRTLQRYEKRLRGQS